MFAAFDHFQDLTRVPFLPSFAIPALTLAYPQASGRDLDAASGKSCAQGAGDLLER